MKLSKPILAAVLKNAKKCYYSKLSINPRVIESADMDSATEVAQLFENPKKVQGILKNKKASQPTKLELYPN